MRLISSTTTAAVVFLGYAVTSSMAQTGPALKTPTYIGCYSSSASLADQGSYIYQAMGWCQPLCVKMSKPVLAFSNGTNCWCGDELPAASAKVSDSECNINCVGYPQNTCGGNSAYAIWNDGLQTTIANSGGSAQSSDTPSSTATGSPTVVQIASTVFITAPGSTSAQIIYTTQAPAASSGPNKAAIAAGVVVTVVVVCAIIGGIMMWLRQRRRRELEEEHRRKEKPQNPSSSSLPDARLEPSVMFQRRQSDGSIADNQDYSRRILKVTNPDGMRDSRLL